MDQLPVQQPPAQDGVKSTEIAPLSIIRSETVLSKLPIHNLSKKGRVDISIVKRNGRGEVELKWEVSYNERHGQARQLAYKLDTIMINRRIDEAGRPLPRVICLGSLREIAEHLDLGGNTAKVKTALRQNVGALVSAKLKYKSTDGTERTLEADFTRYSAVFTGEKLPDGRKADAVYIILNEPYWEVLNNAPVRPLDYDYLKALPPAPQRFYEIISFRMYAALKHRQPYAKLLYSEYCTYSAQQRYFDYDHFKKQMYKVHRPHVQSGYLSKVEYEKATAGDNRADWMMTYTPGPKARAEYAAFTRNPQVFDIKTKEIRPAKAGEGSTKHNTALPALSTEHQVLFDEMARRGITETGARKLLEGLAEHQQMLDQLEYGDFLISQSGSIRNPPGFYLSLLKENITVPADFETRQKRQLREQAKEEKERENYERHLQEEAYENYWRGEIEQFIESRPDEYQRIFEANRRRFLERYPKASEWEPSVLEATLRGTTRSEITEGHLSLLNFKTFCALKRNQQSAPIAAEQGTGQSSNPEELPILTV